MWWRRLLSRSVSLISGLIETREGLQAMSEAEAEGELDVEDMKNIHLETEDMSKMEELE